MWSRWVGLVPTRVSLKSGGLFADFTRMELLLELPQ